MEEDKEAMRERAAEFKELMEQRGRLLSSKELFTSVEFLLA
jgi:hypothetical protein